jgi:hypothetical protein
MSIIMTKTIIMIIIKIKDTSFFVLLYQNYNAQMKINQYCKHIKALFAKTLHYNIRNLHLMLIKGGN